MLDFLETINQLFEAGIAITALSLFIRALTFNLRDRVSRAFAVILACVVVTFSGEAISGAALQANSQEIWLRFQWLGTIFLPAAYIHFADALLETTGKPSKGRRRLLVRLAYLSSGIFLLSLPSILVGPLVNEATPIPYLGRTGLSWLFTAYYGIIMLLAGHTIWRARKRTLLSSSYRRMTVLFAGSFALAVGSYPFLLLGSDFASGNPEIFLGLAAIGNIFVFIALIAMAFASAFFGVAWPDRVIRSRLFKWLLRGPLTVFVVLTIIPLVNRASDFLNTDDSVVLPILIVLSILLIEHIITLLAPVWERWLFVSGEDSDVRLLQTLQDRVLTRGDLRQYLEAILAAVCDRLQTPTAFVASLEGTEMDLIVEVGDQEILSEQGIAEDLERIVHQDAKQMEFFTWGEYLLLPLYISEEDKLIGIMGVLQQKSRLISSEDQEALFALGEKAALALDDRNRQRAVLATLEELTPRVDQLQKLRAASRYDQSEILSDPAALSERELSQYVKDALNHYWGGPKLTESPLRGLRIVQEAMQEHKGNPANAMRAILKQAIDRNRPEGEPGLNAEWLLFNLLELKFLQGRKVRDVARRLAMSEADLYRKQRVAVESIAGTLIEMENQIINNDNERNKKNGKK